jgi:hypothetical protein
MRALAKAAILSGVSSLLAAFTLTIGFSRAARFNPGLDTRQLDSMRYGEAMAYITAHSTHPSAWDIFTTLVTVPAMWLKVGEVAACIFVFVLASTVAAILWSRGSRPV